MPRELVIVLQEPATALAVLAAVCAGHAKTAMAKIMPRWIKPKVHAQITVMTRVNAMSLIMLFQPCDCGQLDCEHIVVVPFAEL